MILPFLLALLAFLALLPILLPLLRGSRPVAARATFDQAVYRDQLAELDRDIARGLITPAEADASRLEIQRRLLAADRLTAAPARLTRSPVLAVIVFVVIGLGSVATYMTLGAPGLPDEPFAARPPEATGPGSMQEATDKLAEKLKQDPSDAQSWLLYARSLAMLGQWDQSADAYQHALTLGQTAPDIRADHAEVLVMAAGGTVTPTAETELQAVLQADPTNGLARYYLAMAAIQAGEPRKAIDGLQSLLGDLPSDSPLRAQIGQRIAEAAQSAGIPTPELAKGIASATQPEPPAAGDMPDAQRDAMIRGMVAQLAAKQQADPDNLDGWLRLGRAYSVLHEADKAEDAYEKAAALKPDDTSIPLQEARALLQDNKPTDKIPAKIVDLLEKIQARDPKEPLVLWYLGIAAAQASHSDAARQYWGSLEALLPADSEDRRMIEAALRTLPPAK